MAAWPVLADPISGVRQGPNAISTYDALLRSPAAADGLRPDLVLRLGAPLTSKSVTSWLDPSVSQVVVDPDGAWLDPLRTSTERIVADPSALLDAVSLRGQGRPPSFWMSSWRQAETAARTGMDRLLDGWPELFEGRVARDLVAGLPDGATLVVGSSMPVRDVETFARPRSGLRFLSNRGVNGIDGFVSTVLGVAAAGSVSPAEPGGGVVVALCGDLTFLHDAGGLLRAARRGLDATFVVIDNDGGGIFSFLPQGRSGAEPAEQFETLFATPQGVDLARLAAVHGVGTERVGSAEELMPAVRRSLEAGGVRLVIVPTDRAENVDRHRQVWEAVSIPGGAPSR